jgi:hypothetical protein
LRFLVSFFLRIEECFFRLRILRRSACDRGLYRSLLFEQQHQQQPQQQQPRATKTTKQRGNGWCSGTADDWTETNLRAKEMKLSKRFGICHLIGPNPSNNIKTGGALIQSKIFIHNYNKKVKDIDFRFKRVDGAPP